jgi:hypothetical protein
MTAPLKLARTQILAFRRRVGALDRRLPAGKRSLRQAAWAGVQDSMPRAALLSIHARVEGVTSAALEDSSLAQVWGPRYHVYVIAARDHAVFTLGRLPDGGMIRARADDLAARAHELLADGPMRYDDAGRALGTHGNNLRYAALTGTLAIRWEGARRPTVWTVPPPEIDAAAAARELGRRYLHVFGPARADGFAKWAGIGVRKAAEVLAGLDAELLPVLTPFGDAWLLARDESAMREPEAPAAAARLLPSGDAYTLGVTSEERALLVPDADRRAELWTPRVWPGALLVDGKVVGTWRRIRRTFTIQTWTKLNRAARDAVLAEAESFPLPDPDGQIVVNWT